MRFKPTFHLDKVGPKSSLYKKILKIKCESVSPKKAFNLVSSIHTPYCLNKAIRPSALNLIKSCPSHPLVHVSFT